jgi:ATP-dependent Clp protease ATP-binding subunit ClpA
MFERFTDRARRAVVLAQEEARQLDHDYIGTEHILLGLLGERDGIAAQSLRRLGVGLNDVRDEITANVGRGDKSPAGHIPFTPRAKKVLELSLREALQLGHNYIGTEHILLGLVREGQGMAAHVLVQRGAPLERVRATVTDALGRSSARPRSSQPEHTPAADEALAAARELAGSGRLGSHHLLEALARSEDSVASRALASLGIDADTLAATIDELGVEGTNDVTPDETAARQMEIRLEGDELHLVLRDDASVELVRTITEHVGGPLRGDDPIGPPVVLWQTIMSGLEELRQRYAPPSDDEDTTKPRRSSIARQALQSRLTRRRRSP